MSQEFEIIEKAINNRANGGFDKEKWKKEKQDQKEWAYKTQDLMAEKIVVDSDKLKQYLKVQSNFPSYSVGNALLVTAKYPQATMLKDRDGWKKEKVYLKRNPKEIVILEPQEFENNEGQIITTYNPKELYDISQTQAKTIKQLPYKTENILKAVLSIAPVKVVISKTELKNNKSVCLDLDNRQIAIKQNTEVNEMLQGLINEIASIQLQTFRDEPLDNFKNKCVTYMISQKYNLPVDNIDLTDIPKELSELDAKQIKEELTPVARCSESLIDGMDRTLGIENRFKTSRVHQR